MLALKLRFWRKLFFIAVSTSYSFLCLRVLISVSTRTYFREYVVLIYDTSLINYFFVLIGGDNVDKPRRGGTIYLA